MESVKHRSVVHHEKDPLLLIDRSDPINKLEAKQKRASASGTRQDKGDTSKTALTQLGLSKWAKAKNHSYFYWSWAIIFTLLGICTRIYCIAESNKVIWDEAHFGKFGSYYLNRTFYSDVHPPLGKMLVGLAGYVSGYDGSFDFPSGQTYPPHVNYVGMRVFLAMFGAFAVPLSYLTAVQLGLSQEASIIVGLCMAFDNGMIGISRLILLDSMLLFFTVLSTFCLSVFISCSDKPFTRKWYMSLACTGISIACASSVKWVGLFVTALVGAHAALDLWHLFGDRVLPTKILIRHLAARTLFLISLPVLVYMGCFYLHFTILNRSGPGDATMNSLFQAGLIGNSISQSPIDVAFGSKVTIRNKGYGGGLLHSHIQSYPEGSSQQQVTCYHHKDANNDFIIKLMHMDGSPEAIEYHKEDASSSALTGVPSAVRLVKDGDTVRLVHAATLRNLHSHFIQAPVTKVDYEVSGYANDTLYVDPNDHWLVEVDSDRMGLRQDKGLQSLSTEFRLKHKATGCYLSSSKSSLPEWGFKQMEVSCEAVVGSSPPTSRNTLWNIESNENAQLPSGDSSLYRSSFLDNFVECNVMMWRTNNALVVDAELEPGQLVSFAYQWPLLSVGLRMASWDDDQKKFYMLGNPLVWWLSTAAVILLSLSFLAILLAWQRGAIKYPSEPLKTMLAQSQVALLGWLLHHVPFYIMGRVLYLHHYYPNLFFAILALGIAFDCLTWCLVHHVVPFAHHLQPLLHQDALGLGLLAVLAAPVIYTFYLFMPICYGMDGPISSYAYLKWVSTWNIL